MWDIERLIETAVWVISIILIRILVPKEKYREAWISFLIMQLPTWVLGLFVAEFSIIEYPERFFAEATSTSFTYEFLALPVVSIIYNLYYPAEKRLKLRLIYIFSFPTILTATETVIEIYTDLIEYIHWNWFCTWVSVTLILQGSYYFYAWFVKGSKRVRVL